MRQKTWLIVHTLWVFGLLKCASLLAEEGAAMNTPHPIIVGTLHILTYGGSLLFPFLFIAANK